MNAESSSCFKGNVSVVQNINICIVEEQCCQTAGRVYDEKKGTLDGRRHVTNEVRLSMFSYSSSALVTPERETIHRGKKSDKTQV